MSKRAPNAKSSDDDGPVGVRKQLIQPQRHSVFLTREKVERAMQAATKVRN